MATATIIEELGFGRAIKLNDETTISFASQQRIIEEVKDFGIDEIYFNSDGKNNYPAVFIKSVNDFSNETLKEIAQIHTKIWNYKKVLLFYVYSKTEIRFYNCSEKPITSVKNIDDISEELSGIELERLQNSDVNKLKKLNKIFSSIAIDSGIIWTSEEAKEIRDKINLQKRVDKYLVKSLINVAQKLKHEGLEINYIHKIIMRSLFLLFLEDREGTGIKLYNSIKEESKSYFDILDDVQATHRLYKKLEDDFNGNLFTVEKDEKITKKQLQLIKKCFTSGYEETSQQKLFEDERLFNFKIIQIELLSEIYENFLSEIDNKEKENTGTFYTPPSLVELILNEQLPVNSNEKNYDLKILDPSCGSGIFLVESYKRLIKRYEQTHKIKKLKDYKTLKKLLIDNIFGIEIEPKSIKVAAFSLYLALLENLDPPTLWQERRLPELINDPTDFLLKKQGKNLYRTDTITTNNQIEDIEFDLVIGNPPFGNKILSNTIKDYCQKNGFAKEMVLPFLHKAIKFSPSGKIALIFNTKVLTNTGSTYQNFRKWIFNECYVEKIYNFSILRKAPKSFGGQLFGSAVGPISIIFYQKKLPKKNIDRILYYAPKTYIKTNVLEGIVIDHTDLKYLPREECKRPDSKIWKISMWGGIEDMKLIEKLTSNFDTIGKILPKYNIKNGVGFQLLTQKKDKINVNNYIPSIGYIDAEKITRYYTLKNRLGNINRSIKSPKAIKYYTEYYNSANLSKINKNINVFRRLGDLEAYKAPHIVLKKGLENNGVCSSYIDVECTFRDGVYGFYADKKNENFLKVLMAYFNSKLSTYFLFMTISSYGIEREQIMKNEYLSIPINIDNLKFEELLKCINKIINNHKKSSLFDDLQIQETFDSRIESIINSSLKLTKREILLIDDLVNYNLELFHNNESAKAMMPVQNMWDYSKVLSTELDEFIAEQSLYANIMIYSIDTTSPLSLVKISFSKKHKGIIESKEKLSKELNDLDKYLWASHATNIYFRKKLNYFDGNDIYIIRPNQRRFWSQSMAMEDASEIISEILNSK